MTPAPLLASGTAAPRRAPLRAVVVGASAGAVEALAGLLPHLPADFPAPVVVVVHVPPDRPSVLVDLYTHRCAVAVKEAEDKEPLMPATVYFAPPNYHVLVEANGTLALSVDPPVLYSRPSIDVLFESAADAFGAGVVGVVLTGANHDGAAGLRAICAAGGTALVQAPGEALVPTMPQAALASCPDALAFPVRDLAAYLSRVGSPAARR